MALSNKSFEIAGTLPGWAQHWTIVVSYAGEVVADFSGGIHDPSSTERFVPGWGNDDYASTITTGSPAAFDAGLGPSLPQYEAFSRWIDTPTKLYRTTITGGTAGQFSGPSGIFTTETFGLDWSNTPYLTTISGGSTVTDNIESGWGNDTYLTTISGGTVAEFGDGDTAEFFGSLFPDVLFTVDPIDYSLFHSPAHGLSDGEPVTILTTGTYPGNLAKNTVYYVIEEDTDSFHLSPDPGGANLYVDNVGVGDHYVHGDPTVYWTTVD